MSQSSSTPLTPNRSRAAEFNAIVRRIDDRTLDLAMSDEMTRNLLLGTIFGEMPDRMVPERVGRDRTVVRWRVGTPTSTGGGPAEWTVVVTPAGCTVLDGCTDESPSVTLDLAVVPFLRLIAGQAGGFALVSSGRLRIKGNLLLAHKIEDWFVRE